ncbi:DUF4336 domain-containing protein [Oscillatoria sp. FACHB-1407]|uniref:DUF4336 domain-containing protein n=1 Tax=Oscillatoria sp. FACHB-1407 TaxID=2692847 RepID=UPI001683BB37|nr:DUF4336 domain-containing protein [Oscillatoria sp. FACHB-1407]MBD2460612.1 DUF4336 domain-containing protein [Oscillatoria sp. FACHB-1407]
MTRSNDLVELSPTGGRVPSDTHPQDWAWRFWFALPLYPYRKRRTLRTEVIPGTVWTFDQLHGILYAVVPIRMTVIRLDSGGLLVYAPVAPTPECIRLVNELVAAHGEVRYIILPTSSGLEHKVFVGPFAQQFPHAQVFVAPNQWSFPLNLPLPWLGFPRDRTQVLPLDSRQAPFSDEFDYEILDFNLGRGSFAEVAVFHRRSHTLLLTDSILSVPEEPPAIAQLDPYPLLFHARDSALEPIEDTPDHRRNGWQRISLFATYFRPYALKTTELKETLRDGFKAPERSPRAYFGFFPFRWQDDWQQSFEALRGNGRPFVAPILQTLILPQAPRTVLAWVDRVAQWNFRHIIPCHFDAPIPATPEEFRRAFAFLKPNSDPQQTTNLLDFPLPDTDMEFVRELEANLRKRGIATAPRESL